jgi:hypothetical protein
MNRKELFSVHRSSKRLNEGLEKTFGQKINLEKFTLEQLEDARNKLRTQISQVRSESNFNENLENDAYHRAKFMLDAIVSEISEREEFIAKSETVELEGKEEHNFTPDDIKDLEKIDDLDTLKSKAFELISAPSRRPMKPEKVDWFKKNLEMKTNKMSVIKLMWDLLLAGEGMRVVGGNRSSQNYRQRFGDSIETEENEMTKVTEGEIQQASAIVTAKTMVDRVGRWIEELSGMENDTLLQLGDSIRDEMGQQQAKAFIETVAPAIQQALDNLKQARETLAGGVRQLTGEEQPAEMLGSEPAADTGEVTPDSMNAEPAADLGDEFSAAEPAAGGAEAAGREQRESVQFQNRLLKVLAG